MKKFIVFLLIILIFTAFIVGFDEFIKNVSLATAIALVLRLVDQVVE